MDGQTLLHVYRQMLVMRRFEEEAARLYTERKIGGFLHLYIGQEAVGAGALSALEPRDYVISAYRIHALYLARNGTARAGMAELLGKETGCSKGRGGSMHFFSAEDRFLGGHGIVGAHVPLAAGAAFASKYRGDGAVCICFLGEGATSIGPFHEGLCLASLYGLPVVYIVENNGYAMGTPQHRQMIAEDVSIRGLAYPMACATADGWDVVEVQRTVKEAVDRARIESRPTLLELKTYRYRGHSMADPGKYRTKEEVEEWKKRDPVLLAEHRLIRDFPQLSSQLDEIRASVIAEIDDAVQFAESSPEPSIDTVGDYTYV